MTWRVLRWRNHFIIYLNLYLEWESNDSSTLMYKIKLHCPVSSPFTPPKNSKEKRSKRTKKEEQTNKRKK